MSSPSPSPSPSSSSSLSLSSSPSPSSHPLPHIPPPPIIEWSIGEVKNALMGWGIEELTAQQFFEQKVDGEALLEMMKDWDHRLWKDMKISGGEHTKIIKRVNEIHPLVSSSASSSLVLPIISSLPTSSISLSPFDLKLLIEEVKSIQSLSSSSFVSPLIAPSDFKILIDKVDAVATEQKAIATEQKAMATEQKAIHSKLATVEKTEKEVQQSLHSLIPPLPINLSSSELGNRLLNNCPLKCELNKLSWLDDHKGDDLTPLLSSSQHSHMSSLYNPSNSRSLPAERVFVASITPFLSELIRMADSSSLLINSEDIQWIPSVEGTVDNRDKPDLFMVPHIAFIPHPLPHPTRHEASKQAFKVRNSFPSYEYLFGECAPPLRDSVCCLFEAKKTISIPNDLGEIFPKLQNLYHHTFVLDYYCVLFDPQELYLLLFSHNGLRSYHHLQWTTPKSRSFFLNWLSPICRRPSWYQSFLKSCEEFKVNPIRSGFLGSGATGKVFKVESNERKGEMWALKVVDHHIDSLRREFEIMNRLHSISFPSFIKDSLPYLSPQCDNPFYLGDVEHPTVGSLLLGPIGESIVKEERSFDLFSQLLNSLFNLHRFLIRHGDPRMPNIIRVNASSSCSSSSSSSSVSLSSSSSSFSRIVWIDLRETQVEYSIHGRFTVDFRIFIRSFFNHSKESTYEDFEADYHSIWNQVKLSKEEIIISPPLPMSQDIVVKMNRFTQRLWDSLK